MQRQAKPVSSPLAPARASAAVYGSDLMVEMLRELGIEYIALNPGASYRGLHDSLVNFPGGGPEIILCPHEEIAVAIANGYARVTGKPMATGLHDVVGLQHAAMAMFISWCSRTPVLNLGGGGPQDATNRRSTDWIHTALVQGNLVREFVKYDDQPASIEAVPESFLRAYRIATTEPMGPVYICLDSDVQEAPIEKPMTVPDASLYRAPAPPRPNLDALNEAAALLVGAAWPVILSGEIGRSAETRAALAQLAELLGAPVIAAEGVGLPTAHPLDVTPLREDVLARADVVLGLDVPSLGVPLGPVVRERGEFHLIVSPETKVINVTMADQQKQSWVTEGMWVTPVAVPIAATTEQTLPELLAACSALAAGDHGHGRKAQERRDEIGRMHAGAAERSAERTRELWDAKPIASGRLYGELVKSLAGRPWAMVQGHNRRWGEMDVSEPDHAIGAGRGGGVGTGLPSSIGSALALKGSGRLCVTVLGDGDFFMTSNALWTAAKYDIPLLVLIYNNHSYYNDEEHQERIAVRRERPVENKGVGIRIEDPAPDFAGLARSLGVAGFGPVSDPAQLGDVLDEALTVVAGGKPAVVDIETQVR